MNKCPVCGSTHTEEHGNKPGDYHWTLCRECGWNTPREDEHGRKNS